MNNFSIKPENHNFLNKLSVSFKSGNQWFQRTPERSLEEAYKAALAIQTIEQEFFQGKTVSPEQKLYSRNIFQCFQDDVNRYLNVIKVRMTLFQVSRNIIHKAHPDLWEKIKFIDQVLERYQPDFYVDVDRINMTDSEKSNNQISNNTISTSNFINHATSNNVTQKSGVLPRSIGRTFQKISNELDNNADEKLLKIFQQSRRNTKTAINFLVMLVVIPLLAQQVSKNLLIKPAVIHWSNSHQLPTFINSEMKEEALHELRSFEEEIKFNNLLTEAPKIATEEIEKAVTEKANEIAIFYQEQGRNAISNIFADLIGLGTFCLVVFFNRSGWIACQTFMNGIIYDLSDSAKAFIIILFTDIFVEFHSPHGWEVLLEGISNHLGIAPNHSLIFLFIATFPVILDTIFKYWIFRYLNQVSPSAVATLKNMNE